MSKLIRFGGTDKSNNANSRSRHVGCDLASQASKKRLNCNCVSKQQSNSTQTRSIEVLVASVNSQTLIVSAPINICTCWMRPVCNHLTCAVNSDAKIPK